VNANARVEGLQDALAVLLVLSASALIAARRIPDEPVGAPTPGPGADRPPKMAA